MLLVKIKKNLQINFQSLNFELSLRMFCFWHLSASDISITVLLIYIHWWWKNRDGCFRSVNIKFDVRKRKVRIFKTSFEKRERHHVKHFDGQLEKKYFISLMIFCLWHVTFRCKRESDISWEEKLSKQNMFDLTRINLFEYMVNLRAGSKML